LESTQRMMGITDADPALFDDLQLMEMAALKVWNEKGH